MPARNPLQSLAWLLVLFAVAVCCTRLESGSDTFGPLAEGGSGAGSVAGGRDSSGAGSSQAGASATGGSDAAAGSSAVMAGGGEGGAQDACFDPRGFDGLGCDRCPPTDGISLENACSDATCKQFDNAARLPLVVKGKLPELPMPGSGGSGGGQGGSGSGGGGAAGMAGAGGSVGGGGVGFDCESLAASGTVIHVTGSSAAKPFLVQIAQQLAIQEPKVFVVYTPVGSCTGVDAIVNGTLMKTGAAPLPASAIYWDPVSNTAKACDLPKEGVNADLGISDVFAPSCPGFELANLDSLKIRDAHGPIQTMTFAVPANSKYREISQQAAYMVFGFGKNGQVLDPSATHPIWNDESSILQRSGSSGTQAMLAAAIGVPSSAWKGKTNKTSDDVAAALQSASATQSLADATIGILGADYIDSNKIRAQIRMLAYQDSHQTCAVTPDSNPDATDKRNVRDGHYPIWGPLHLLYKVDDKGAPANASIRDQLLGIVGYLSGTKAFSNGISLFDVYAKSGLIPECAMRVARSADGGPILPVKSANPCSCLFEVKATGKTTCQSCKQQGDCATGQICSQGLCETP